MANALTNTGLGGVAGTPNYATRTITGSYGTAIGDKGTLAVTDNHSVRRSVARTSRANPSTSSQVFSETAGLRFAYSTQDGDSPALTATRTAI